MHYLCYTAWLAVTLTSIQCGGPARLLLALAVIPGLISMFFRAARTVGNPLYLLALCCLMIVGILTAKTFNVAVMPHGLLPVMAVTVYGVLLSATIHQQRSYVVVPAVTILVCYGTLIFCACAVTTIQQREQAAAMASKE